MGSTEEIVFTPKWTMTIKKSKTTSAAAPALSQRNLTQISPPSGKINGKVPKSAEQLYSSSINYKRTDEHRITYWIAPGSPTSSERTRRKRN